MTNRSEKHVLGMRTIFMFCRRTKAYGHFVVKQFLDPHNLSPLKD